MRIINVDSLQLLPLLLPLVPHMVPVHRDPQAGGAWGHPAYTKENLIGEQTKQKASEGCLGGPVG